MVWMDRLRIMMGILIVCIGIGLSITPCLAGERYLSDGPDFFVSLGSTSELIPGATAELPVTIGNKGTVTLELYTYLSMQPMYLPTTAKSTIIELLPGDAPVLVRSNPQIIGEVQAGQIVPATFTVEIPQAAPAGNYTMLARINYSYVPRIEQQGSADMTYYFKEEKTVLPIPIKIRRMVLLGVEKVESNDLSAGGEGVINFTIRNTGQDTGIGTSLFLVPEGSSPIVPYSNSVYIGEFPPGASSNRVSRSRFQAMQPRGFHIPCPSMRHTRTSRVLLRLPPRSTPGYRSRKRSHSNVLTLHRS